VLFCFKEIVMPLSRPIVRDQRDYDQTSLRRSFHGANLHRDYSAHFFRWSFARRFIKPTHHVLEVGCGTEKPLARLLFKNSMPLAASYTGVDLNPLTPEGAGAKATFVGEFNFVKDGKKLARPGGYDVIVHLEVIEHMHVKLGAQLLKRCFELLAPGGTMLMSTPVYDGKRHAANHIHEYTVEELQTATEKAGFTVERRFGTFMDLRHIKQSRNGKVIPEGLDRETAMRIGEVAELLCEYFDRDAISNIFGPLYPDHSRNNLWLCRRPK
jgi:2-polyprenyl-3-methyl-5-hydroxy-6-metoxy-1,4-benzoquinol methylase